MDYFNELPIDIILQILCKLSNCEDVLHCSSLSKRIRSVFLLRNIWGFYVKTHFVEQLRGMIIVVPFKQKDLLKRCPFSEDVPVNVSEAERKGYMQWVFKGKCVLKEQLEEQLLSVKRRKPKQVFLWDQLFEDKEFDVLCIGFGSGHYNQIRMSFDNLPGDQPVVELVGLSPHVYFTNKLQLHDIRGVIRVDNGKAMDRPRITVRIRNIQVSVAKQEQQGKISCVKVTGNCHLSLKDCRLDGGICGVQCEGSDLIMENCVVERSIEYGCFLEQSPFAVVSNCTFVDCFRKAMIIQPRELGTGDVLVKGNTIYMREGRTNGKAIALVTRNDVCHIGINIRDNDIRNCTIGIAVSSSPKPRAESCKHEACEGCVIVCQENSILKPSDHGIRIKGSEMKVRRKIICRGNNISGAGGNGIQVVQSQFSDVTMTKNSISDCREMGIFVFCPSECHSVKLEENELSNTGEHRQLWKSGGFCSRGDSAIPKFQEMFKCVTCFGRSKNFALCITCATKCHENHAGVVFIGRLSGICECETKVKCQCPKEESEEDSC